MDILVWLKEGWVILAAVIGGITLIWNFINKTLKEIKTEITRPLNEISCRFDAIEEKIDAKHRNDETVLGTLLSMQRKSILDSCELYIKNGYANLHQKETLAAQFESYQALGGNSFAHDLVQQVQDLPLEKPVKNKKNSKGKDILFE